MHQSRLLAASAFEKTIAGKQTHLFTLKNLKGMEVALTNFGGRIVSIWVADKNGRRIDVVEGFDSVDGFADSTEPYYGGLIGRFANRIANGRFNIAGKAYTLEINNDMNTLHGGSPGYQDVVWDAQQTDASTLRLTYLSKDMEGGFPGNLHIKVIYHVTEDNGLQINYEATTDQTTVVNLTSHPYFNLNGAGSGDILDHEVQIFARKYIPVNENLIPTGKLEAVNGTPFDFTEPVAIGKRINQEHEQLNGAKGYDHTYVLDPQAAPAAFAIGDKSGIKLEVFTEEPGMQFYSGNFMQGKNTMKHGKKDEFRTAFAMETQHFPDSPNQPSFPSTLLKPGEVYKTKTEYRFSLA